MHKAQIQYKWLLLHYDHLPMAVMACAVSHSVGDWESFPGVSGKTLQIHKEEILLRLFFLNEEDAEKKKYRGP